jgi:hypothetical protein
MGGVCSTYFAAAPDDLPAVRTGHSDNLPQGSPAPRTAGPNVQYAVCKLGSEGDGYNFSVAQLTSCVPQLSVWGSKAESQITGWRF